MRNTIYEARISRLVYDHGMTSWVQPLIILLSPEELCQVQPNVE